MAYTYKNPVDKGYKKFKLTRKQHNTLFPRRKIKWNTRYEYYYNDNYVVLQQFASNSAIALTTVLFPFLVLLAGLSNIKEAVKELKHLYNEKKYGKFFEDVISKSNRGKNKYEEIIEYLKEQGVIE